MWRLLVVPTLFLWDKYLFALTYHLYGIWYSSLIFNLILLYFSSLKKKPTGFFKRVLFVFLLVHKFVFGTPNN